MKKLSLEEIIKNSSDFCLWKCHEDTSNISSIGLGAIVSYICYPSNYDVLKFIIKNFVNSNIKYVVIGNLTNTLIKSSDIVLISLKHCESYIKDAPRKTIVSSNISSNYLALKYAKKEYDTFVALTMIPGTLGAAIYNNSSVYNMSIFNYILKVKFIDEKGKIRSVRKPKCYYRGSSFSGRNIIILEAKFIKHYNHDSLLDYKDIVEKRRLTQPSGKSLGSIFKNGNDYKSGKLIEDAGLKGFVYNNIEISTVHANIIVNNGGNIIDFLNVIFYIELVILLKFNIRLSKEIFIV